MQHEVKRLAKPCPGGQAGSTQPRGPGYLHAAPQPSKEALQASDASARLELVWRLQRFSVKFSLQELPKSCSLTAGRMQPVNLFVNMLGAKVQCANKLSASQL